MRQNLLIVGAGTYAVVAAEIAADMGVFEKIDFVDDVQKTTPTGDAVIGTTQDMKSLAPQYGNIAVAIGNPEARNSLLKRIQQEADCNIVSLISPHAYVAPSAKIMPGCIIEPMAVIHTQCTLEQGCIVSAGAVVNHASTCETCVHVDCNATVAGYSRVPADTKIGCGEVYRG